MDATNDRMISVYCDEGETLHCSRCKTRLDVDDVAMLIRSTPGEGFATWCPSCTLFVTFHAASDLGFVDLVGTI